MSDLEKIKKWLSTYPNFDILGNLQVDYVDQVSAISSLVPAGLVEIRRSEDIIGNITILNQYNFALYAVLAKAPGDESGASYNADWLMDFQKWVQEQSAQGKAPKFGNTDAKEIAKAQNGAIYEQIESGVAIYFIQLSITYNTFYSAN